MEATLQWSGAMQCTTSRRMHAPRNKKHEREHTRKRASTPKQNHDHDQNGTKDERKKEGSNEATKQQRTNERKNERTNERSQHDGSREAIITHAPTHSLKSLTDFYAKSGNSSFRNNSSLADSLSVTEYSIHSLTYLLYCTSINIQHAAVLNRCRPRPYIHYHCLRYSPKTLWAERRSIK